MNAETIFKYLNIGTILSNEKDYIEVMLIEHNFQYDRSLNKAKLCENCVQLT